MVDKKIGIKVITWDKKTFYFYTNKMSEAEYHVKCMGYDKHGIICERFDISKRKKPSTPIGIKFYDS